MANIQPFRALRPRKDLADKVASRPYDVLSAAEARVEAEGNPYSFYHISKPEIDLPDDADAHSAAVYEKAAQNLQQFVTEGTLFKEEKPCLYIYRLRMPAPGEPGKVWEQTGLSAVSAVADYNNGIIKKHELTRPDKELDRINHIKATRAQTGNVFLAYTAVEEIDEMTEIWKSAHEPEYDFTAGDGIQHTVWIVDDDQIIRYITGLFAGGVPFTYVADGHHRAASAALVQKEFAAQGLTPTGEEPVNYFLTTLFPAGQLTILDYNRLVKDLNGLGREAFLSALEKDFILSPNGTGVVKPMALHEFGMYLEGNWYRLTARDGAYDATDPIGVLDVTILQNNLLDRVLGIKDPRTDQRIEFVGGIRGLGELVKRVDSREMAVAFALFPVTIRQLFDIADNGKVMPPKSTWFEPKLRDGLLTHVF